MIAPMALQCEDLEDLHAISAVGLFPRVTTWVGIRRDRVFRRYMKELVQLLAPHWDSELIDRAAAAATQEEVDDIALDVALPLRNGCSKGLRVAA